MLSNKKLDVKIVSISPRYQINVGYIARVSMNFGVKKIEFVNPRCKITGITAIKFSKAAHPLLKAAKQRSNIDEAIKGTFSIATTGIWRKGNTATDSIYTLKQVLSLLRKSKPNKISIVLGRDDTGLRQAEIKKCDIALFIPTSPLYPVLNISHALSIILYYIMQSKLSASYTFESFYATQKEKDSLSNLFKIFVNKNKRIKNKKAVAQAFKRILDKSHPTRKELNSIAVAISPKQ